MSAWSRGEGGFAWSGGSGGSGPRGVSAWFQGVCLPGPGGSAWSGGCLPGPGGWHPGMH